MVLHTYNKIEEIWDGKTTDLKNQPWNGVKIAQKCAFDLLPHLFNGDMRNKGITYLKVWQTDPVLTLMRGLI